MAWTELLFFALEVEGPFQYLWQGPGGVWCDVDVVEFSYFGAPAPTPKEQLYTELVDGLRGSDPCIGSGSQVVSFSSRELLFYLLVKLCGKKNAN